MDRQNAFPPPFELPVGVGKHFVTSPHVLGTGQAQRRKANADRIAPKKQINKLNDDHHNPALTIASTASTVSMVRCRVNCGHTIVQGGVGNSSTKVLLSCLYLYCDPSRGVAISLKMIPRRGYQRPPPISAG